ncbi:MAG: DUF4468 domain-containing protein [Flavitalea sp.]
MKLLLFLICIPSVLIAQTLPVRDGRVIFEQADSSVSATRFELFKRAKQWIDLSLKDGLQEVQTFNQETGEITLLANGNIPTDLLSSPMEKISFTVNIFVKDNAFRTELIDIVGWPYMKETSKMSIEQLNNRYNNTGKKKEKGTSADSKESDKITLNNVLMYMNLIQESLRETLRKNSR